MSGKQLPLLSGFETCMLLNQKYKEIPEEERLLESDNALDVLGYPKPEFYDDPRQLKLFEKN